LPHTAQHSNMQHHATAHISTHTHAHSSTHTHTLACLFLCLPWLACLLAQASPAFGAFYVDRPPSYFENAVFRFSCKQNVCFIVFWY
jgi:hypothetical protein